MFRIKVLLLGMLLCFAISMPVQASDSIEKAGEVLTFLLPATAAGLTIGLKDTEGMLQFGESAALALGISYGLKYTINETRPNGKDHSFPSNHASLSFASAEFMRKRYGWEYGIPAYVAATFVGYSRVESKQHYTHDVIAGAVIGIGSSYLFTQPYKGWQIGLDIDPEYYGILLSCRW
jgi:membrane-associated phospholipid phosphatase